MLEAAVIAKVPRLVVFSRITITPMLIKPVPISVKAGVLSLLLVTFKP